LSHEQLLDQQSSILYRHGLLCSVLAEVSASKQKYWSNQQQVQPSWSNQGCGQSSWNNQGRGQPMNSGNFSNNQTRLFNPAGESILGKAPFGHTSTSDLPKLTCQICGKATTKPWIVIIAWTSPTKEDMHPSSKLAALVSQANTPHEEGDWLADSAANHHIKATLEKLALQQPYKGDDTVTVGNGSGLKIANTGSFSYPLSNSIIHLKNILHCPAASANLLSINKFCKDNNCWFKLPNSYFFC
jgi:hypothetical protein